MNPDIMKKIGREMSILMGVSLSLILSLVGNLSSGHFTPVGFLVSFIASTLLSLLISFLVPFKKLTTALDAALGIKSGTLNARLFESLVSDLLYTPLITLSMVLLAWNMMCRQAPPEAQIPFLPMFLHSLLLCLVIGYVLIFFLTPLYLNLTLRRNGITPSSENRGPRS